MENNAIGAIMTALTKPLSAPFSLALRPFPKLFSFTARRRRATTIDLIHAWPHLLRDIGATEYKVTHRSR